MSVYGDAEYGVGAYGSGIAKRIQSYVPANVYSSESILMAMLGAEGAEFDTIRANLIDIIFMHFTTTVSGWGLVFWEDQLLLHPATNDSDEVRRARIQAAWLGVGAPTRFRTQELATLFQNGAISVVEDYPNKNVIITFLSQLGVPANIADFQNYMRSIIPGHLAITYLFIYVSWAQWDTHNFTWTASDALGPLTWAQHDVYV